MDCLLESPTDRSTLRRDLLIYLNAMLAFPFISMAVAWLTYGTITYTDSSPEFKEEKKNIYRLNIEIEKYHNSSLYIRIASLHL